MLGETMSINKLFAVLDCQPTTPNRLRGEARNGRRAIYVDRSRRPDGDLRDKPGCVPASGCTKGAPWRATRCIGADGSPVGGAQQRRPSPYLVSQEEKPSKSARGAGPPGKAKARSAKNATPIPPNNAVATRNKWRVTIAHPLPANAQVDRGTGQWFAVPPS